MFNLNNISSPQFFFNKKFRKDNGCFRLSVKQEIRDEGYINIIRILGKNKCGEKKDITFTYQFLDNFSPFMPVVYDAFIIASWRFLIENATTLEVNGPVSTQFIRNLRSFNEIYCYKNNKFSHFKIIAKKYLDNIAYETKHQRKSLLAYSRGVDATFSLMRHSKKFGILSQYEKYNVSDILLVHGFDVHSNNIESFSKLSESFNKVLKRYKLNLIKVRTNIKDFSFQDWESGYVAMLSSIFHQMHNKYSLGIFGSTLPGEYTNFLDASRPDAINLLSNPLMKVCIDGSGYDRIQKLMIIAKNKFLVSDLRFCWQGLDSTGNCGVCEKCLRTKLNFLAAGLPLPKIYLNQSLDFQNLFNQQLHINSISVVELNIIYQHAKKNKLANKKIFRFLKSYLENFNLTSF